MIPKIVPPSQTKASGKPYTLDYNYQTIFTPSSLVIKHGSGILPIWFDDSPINTSISGGFPTKNPTSSPCLIGNSSHVWWQPWEKNLPNMTSSAAWRTCCKRRNRSSTCRNVRPLEGHCLMKYWFTLFACMCIYIYCIVYIHFYSRNLIICHKYITYPALSDDSSFSMVETSEINLDPSGIIACLSACMHPSWQQYVLVHIYIYIDIFNIRVRCVYIYML